MMGPPQVELDNADDIDALLDAYNDTRLSGPEPGCSIQRVGIEGLLGLMGIFGIAWINRGQGRRRRRQ